MNPSQPGDPEPVKLRLDPDVVELLAARIVQLLAQHLTPPPTSSLPSGRLLSAAEVSAWWGVSRGWVYQHANELGAVRIGDGQRPRLRFDPDRVAEHLNQPAATPPATAAPARRRARRSPRIRSDPARLAFRADPELTSLHNDRRWPGDARTSPAAAPKTTASTR